jgi:hypothetical protein
VTGGIAEKNLLLVVMDCYSATTSKLAGCIPTKREGRKFSHIGLAAFVNWEEHMFWLIRVSGREALQFNINLECRSVRDKSVGFSIRCWS